MKSSFVCRRVLTASTVKSFAQAFSKACQIPKVKPLVELRRVRNLFAYPKIRTGALTVHWTVNARETQLGGLPKGGIAVLFIYGSSLHLSVSQMNPVFFRKKRVNGAASENRECEQTAKVFLHENAQNFQHTAILPKIGKYTNKAQEKYRKSAFFHRTW